MAAVDPETFLRSTPPFDVLPDALFARAARALEVSFNGAGTRLAERGQRPLEHLYVVRTGAVRLERDGQPLALIEEGETFGVVSLASKQATFDVVVESDLLAYRIPRAVFEELLRDSRFAGHFADRLADRFNSTLERSQVATFQADLAAPLLTLVRRAPVFVQPSLTVGEAAQVMKRERISSLLVQEEPLTILTERDFCNRVLAAGLPPSTPLNQLEREPAQTLAAQTPIYEAWTRLIDQGVKHLVLVREGAPVGVVTANDLFRSTAQGPVAVLRGVERMSDRGQLPGYAKRVMEMCSALLAGGLHTSVIAGFVARLNDALVRRIVRWAERDSSGAPCAWAFLVHGSEGRMEQTLLTDQDNALLYADAGTAHAAWFQAFAERVNDDLEAAGFPRCPGGYMARNWNGALGETAARFQGWVASHAPQGVMDAAIFVDSRKVAGDLDCAPFAAEVLSAGKDRLFLAALAKSALESQPPSSLMLRLRGDSSEVDIKAQGLKPIVHLARCHALEVGSDRRNTLERLDAAVRAGLMDKDVRATVGDAFLFLNGLRLRLQLRRLAASLPSSSSIKLAELSATERTRLKDSFRAISEWQELAAYHYRTHYF